MIVELYVTSRGRLRVESNSGDSSEPAASVAYERIERAFSSGEGAGLLHLATVDGKAVLPPSLAFARSFAHSYFTQLCHLTESAHVSDAMLIVAAIVRAFAQVGARRCGSSSASDRSRPQFSQISAGFRNALTTTRGRWANLMRRETCEGEIFSSRAISSCEPNSFARSQVT